MYSPPIELLEKVGQVLQEPLDAFNIETLKAQLVATEAIRYELSYKRCEWLEKLMKERERARMPKDKDYSEMDRKTMLDASTSMVEGDYAFLVSLEDIVKDRINLGSLFLQSL